MFRIFLLLTILLLHPAMLHAQTVTATFRNAVNSSPVSAGTLSLYNLSNQQTVFENQASGYQTMIYVDTDYRARTDQDRLTISSELFKHQLWDDQVDEYLLTNDFSVSLGTTEITKTADFTNARKTTLFNNFEEFTDEGEVRFRDPWYVDDQGQQPGGFPTFTSPLVPTGAYGESQPAVLLGKTVQASFPYYSLKFHSFLQSDYETPKDAPLTDDDWVLIGAHARDAGDVALALELF